MSTTFKVTINRDTLERLAEVAVAERRPLDLMAEVLIMRQLGCWCEPQATAARVTPQGPTVEVTSDVPAVARR
jgi:hypothetical protein